MNVTENMLKLAAALKQGKRPEVKRTAMQGTEFKEVGDSDVDYELESPNQLFGSHINMIPMQNAVAGSRLFYGARFLNQALPLKNAEAPLVQSLPDGADRTFDEEMGKHAGAVYADKTGEITSVTPDEIEMRDEAGEKHKIGLYNHQGFNRKTEYHNTPVVRPGALVKPGHLLAKSNYTDDKGTLAMGINARVGLVPYHGRSMDDAIVVSDSFARRMNSQHLYGHDLDYKRGIQGGKAHYVGIFPQKFTKPQLDLLDEDGVVKPGQIIQPGDPIILATRPRVVSSQASQLGLLSKHMKNSKSEASVLWDHETPGTVLDVKKLRSGVKVNVSTEMPLQEGDKITFRTGLKSIISTIIPDRHMPRTADGKPLEVLMNHLGLPSRTNDSFLYELMLGKIAAKTGQTYKLPAFNKSGEDWHKFVTEELKKHGVLDTEEVFDPLENKKLENPITVGNSYVQKLHHIASDKISMRGQGSYNIDMQPAHGSGESAQCFAPKQTVNTTEGPIPIARICEKRLRSNVWSWNDHTQEWCFRPITDWFIRRAKLEELVTVKFVSNCDRYSCDSHKTYNHACIQVTKNHDIWTPIGKRPVGDLHVGDEILTWGPVITQDQRRFLLGTMLGDGHVHNDNGEGDFIRIEHSNTQANYVWWKQSILSGLGAYHFCTDRTASDSSIVVRLTGKTGIQALAVNCGLPYITKWLRRFCYNAEGKKLVGPLWLKEIDGFVFAVNFLDTGSMHYSPSTSKFNAALDNLYMSVSECHNLALRLKEVLGIDFSVYESRRLGVTNRAGCDRIAQEIAKWIPWTAVPASKKYLVQYCKKIQETAPPCSLDIINRMGRVPVEITAISPYVHDKPGIPEINVYDFSVLETHNYCASSINVSNSKRLSGLEHNALLSAGAYNFMREGATLRGSKQDEYWRMLRQGYEPKEPGQPFVWAKFKALLNGSGYLSKSLGDGRERLQLWTDKDLEALKPIDVRSGDMVDIDTLEPRKGGLFDPAITGNKAWGQIKLPFAVPSPAAEDMIRKLLGLTQKQFRAIIAGEAELPEHLRLNKNAEARV